MIDTRPWPGMHKHFILPSVCPSRSSKEHEVPLDHSLLRHRRCHSRLWEEDWERPEERISLVGKIVVTFYNDYLIVKLNFPYHLNSKSLLTIIIMKR